MSGSEHQTLRMLEGRYLLERLRPGESPLDGDVLAVVNGPDGGARMRRDDSAGDGADAWVALWNGDAAHPPDAPGMLAAIVGPLGAGGIPVWAVASFDGDIVLIPADRADEARDILRLAGHEVTV